MKIYRYLKQEGFKNTYYALLNKFRKSETIFFNYQINNKINEKYENIVGFQRKYSQSFNEMKFYSFINTEEFLMSDNKEIYLYKENDEILGYACVFMTDHHIVNNKFKVSLREENSIWIGPVYVLPKARGKRINKKLVETILYDKKAYDSAYTCINSNNNSSIKSFEKIGFQPVERRIFDEGIITFSEK